MFRLWFVNGTRELSDTLNPHALFVLQIAWKFRNWLMFYSFCTLQYFETYNHSNTVMTHQIPVLIHTHTKHCLGPRLLVCRSEDKQGDELNRDGVAKFRLFYTKSVNPDESVFSSLKLCSRIGCLFLPSSSIYSPPGLSDNVKDRPPWHIIGLVPFFIPKCITKFVQVHSFNKDWK